MNTDRQVTIQSVAPITLTDKALYDAAKNTIAESPKVARDFCQFMITISTSSIPTYIALLSFIVSTRHTIVSSNDFYIIIPTAFFILSTILFAVAYLPRHMDISLDTIDAIRLFHTREVMHRMRIVIMSFSFFIIGLISAVMSIFYIMIVAPTATTGPG